METEIYNLVKVALENPSFFAPYSAGTGGSHVDDHLIERRLNAIKKFITENQD